MSIRILLADDHEIFLGGLRFVLSQQSDMKIVGEVTNGREAVDRARACHPHVAILDVTMPETDGIGATRRLAAEVPGLNVLCLSVHAERQFVKAALDAGAVGYLVKGCSPAELVRAVRAVHAGRSYLSPEIAGIVVEGCKAARSGGETAAGHLLTLREQEVLQLIAAGYSTKEIAGRLGLSIKTIGTHRENIMGKLQIPSIAGLTKYAVREGLASIDD